MLENGVFAAVFVSFGMSECDNMGMLPPGKQRKGLN